MAQETQYCSLRYILGTVYSAKTEASEMSPVKKTFVSRLDDGQDSAGNGRGRGAAWALQQRQLQPGCLDIRIAADSTILRMVNLLMALSLGVHREQLEQRMGFTWPRPFLLRPLFFLCSRNGRSAFARLVLSVEPDWYRWAWWGKRSRQRRRRGTKASTILLRRQALQANATASSECSGGCSWL